MMPTERAIFAAGCFWGIEAEFRALEGVSATSVGYCGGDAEHPTYERVCRGRTGHAEAVEVVYDAEVLSYEDLLGRFWVMHNPTTRNRQGWDVGSQYRSAIFTTSAEQQQVAIASRDERQSAVRRKIVTEIEPAASFWPAEDYHQHYFEKNGRASCAVSVHAGQAA